MTEGVFHLFQHSKIASISRMKNTHELFTYAQSQDTVILTPNRRLAAHLLKSYGDFQITQNRKVWETPSILPLSIYFEQSWQTLENKNISLPLIVKDDQALIVWQQIIESSSVG